MNWRLLTDDSVPAAFGLAADETLARRVGRGDSPPTLRLYTYRSHCALVGRFQRIETEIHLDFCNEHGIEINRRPTGGGAILMGSEQLGVALTLPGSGEGPWGRPRVLMERFSAGLLRALGRLGVEASFRRKNDIEVDGRKIAGLGIHRAASGGLLFHASLLVDLDVPLMLQVLNTPFEKISDKAIATVDARITTVCRETGRQVSVNEVRQKVAQGYAAVFGVGLQRGDFTPEERQETRILERTRYATQEWVFQTTNVSDAVGTARMKTPGGLLEVTARLAGRTVKEVFITGDFFASENFIAHLEGSLRWHASDAAEIASTVRRVASERPHEVGTIPLAALTETVVQAVQRGVTSTASAPTRSYGCFVNPEEARG